MSTPRKPSRPLKAYIDTGRAHDMASYLLSLPSETLVSRIRIEHRGFYEEHDARKAIHVKATLKQWDADSKVEHDKRKAKRGGR